MTTAFHVPNNWNSKSRHALVNLNDVPPFFLLLFLVTTGTYTHIKKRKQLIESLEQKHQLVAAVFSDLLLYKGAVAEKGLDAQGHLNVKGNRYERSFAFLCFFSHSLSSPIPSSWSLCLCILVY